MFDTKGQEGEPPFELWSSLMLYLVRTLRACNVQYWVDGFRVMQPSVDWLDWFVACVVWTYLTIFWMRGGEASVPKISLQEAQLQRIGHKRQAALLLQLHTYYGRCWKTFSVPNACVVGKKWNNEMQCRWSGSGSGCREIFCSRESLHTSRMFATRASSLPTRASSCR